MTTFTIDAQQRGKAAVVRLAGELDWVSAAELTPCLDQLLRNGCTDVRIDALRLTFCDAAALSVLVRGNNGCISVGGRLTIVGATGIVARVLKVTGLDEYLGDPLAKGFGQQERDCQ